MKLIRNRSFSSIAGLSALPAAAASMVERYALQALDPVPSTPPLFVIGAPRCGTTLPYLYLINRFRFAYFPNCAKRAPKLAVSMGAFARLGRNAGFGHESSYGSVDGFSAPSDGWEIYQRWFPRYAINQLPSQRLVPLRRTIGAYERLFGGPFLSKNNHNSIRIRELGETFPDALFVHITRDLVDASTSLLEARLRHGIELGEWWSCPAPQYMNRAFSSQAEQSVLTILGIKEHVRAELQAVPERRWLEVSYEKFCSDPTDLANWVRSHYSSSQLRDRPRDPDANFSSRVNAHQCGTLRHDVQREIERLLNHGDGGL